jgi:hypothetical protein
MKTFQKILLVFCWLFVHSAIIKLMIHIVRTEIQSTTNLIALIPLLIFISVLIYFSGGLVYSIVKSKKTLSNGN